MIEWKKDQCSDQLGQTFDMVLMTKSNFCVEATLAESTFTDWRTPRDRGDQVSRCSDVVVARAR